MSTTTTCYPCYDQDLDALIYQSKVTLESLSNEIVKAKSFGFSCDANAEYKVKMLNIYLRLLEDDYRKLALGGNLCLTDYKMQSLIEKVRKLTTSCNIIGRRDVTVDESGEDAWIAQNPYCVSRETWEKIAYKVCDAFNITLTSTEQVCDLGFEIVRNIIPCDVMVAFSVYEEMCNLGFTVTRTEDECQIDFDILVSETNCDINFATYKELISENLTYDVIKTVVVLGMNFEISGDGVQIVTPLSKYPVTSLGSKNPDIQVLKDLGVDMSNSEYAKNPTAFINKLKQDYGKK